MLSCVDCKILITSYKLLILVLYFHFVLVKTLSDTQYLKSIKRACKCLKLISKKYLHFGRVTASSLVDMVEGKADISRAVGNWKNDYHFNFNIFLVENRSINRTISNDFDELKEHLVMTTIEMTSIWLRLIY